jgi:hypothetical protein
VDNEQVWITRTVACYRIGTAMGLQTSISVQKLMQLVRAKHITVRDEGAAAKPRYYVLAKSVQTYIEKGFPRVRKP